MSLEDFDQPQLNTKEPEAQHTGSDVSAQQWRAPVGIEHDAVLSVTRNHLGQVAGSGLAAYIWGQMERPNQAGMDLLKKQTDSFAGAAGEYAKVLDKRIGRETATSLQLAKKEPGSQDLLGQQEKLKRYQDAKTMLEAHTKSAGAPLSYSAIKTTLNPLPVSELNFRGSNQATAKAFEQQLKGLNDLRTAQTDSLKSGYRANVMALGTSFAANYALDHTHFYNTSASDRTKVMDAAMPALTVLGRINNATKLASIVGTHAINMSIDRYLQEDITPAKEKRILKGV